MIFSDEDKKTIEQNINILTEALVMGIDKYYPEQTKTMEWQAMSEAEKTASRRMLFELKYGKTDKEFAYDLYQKIINS